MSDNEMDLPDSVKSKIYHMLGKWKKKETPTICVGNMEMVTEVYT